MTLVTGGPSRRRVTRRTKAWPVVANEGAVVGGVVTGGVVAGGMLGTVESADETTTVAGGQVLVDAAEAPGWER